MFRDLLAQAGIEVHVFNENAQGGLGEIPFTHAYPELWLREASDETRAREVLRSLESQSRRPDRTCRACGEVNPGAFDVCWRCGESL